MRYVEVKGLREGEFRRLTGIKRRTFEKMVEILKKEERKKKEKGGKPNKLSIEDMLLMTLEYLREYRTYFHISKSYGISESASYRNIRWVEEVLVKQPDFRLPGRKELLKSNVEYEVVLIDVTESPIERPKKNRGSITQVRRRDIQ